MALFWDRLPSPVGYMEWVSCAGPFLLLALYGEVCGFSALTPPLEGVSPFLHQGLSLVVVLSFHPVLRALLRSFRVSPPSRAVRRPSWALALFLRHLSSSSFGSSPLASPDGSLFCGLSDGHPCWQPPGSLPLFFVRPRFRLSIVCPSICCQV